MYDVIVVGSGVAGSYIASMLDADVLLLEKDKRIILKDSGIVSSRFSEFFQNKSLIQDSLNEIQFVSPSGLKFSLSSEESIAHILKRKHFSLHLRKHARKNAKISYENVKKIKYLDNAVEVHTDKEVHICKLIVGADGAASVVRKSLQIQDPKIYTGIFARTKRSLASDVVRVYLNKYFSPDFFAWSIPQNKEYGLITAIRPYEYFQYFKTMLKFNEGEIFSSLIPIKNTSSFSNRAILVGDACGHTKPLTGGGIIFSLLASRHAINTINQACSKKDFSKNFLSQYESLWKKEFESEIRKQLLARRLYRKLTNYDIDKLFRDFGPSIEKLESFDYDKLTGVWRQMPKRKLFKFLISHMLSIL